MPAAPCLALGCRCMPNQSCSSRTSGTAGNPAQVNVVGWWGGWTCWHLKSLSFDIVQTVSKLATSKQGSAASDHVMLDVPAGCFCRLKTSYVCCAGQGSLSEVGAVKQSIMSAFILLCRVNVLCLHICGRPLLCLASHQAVALVYVICRQLGSLINTGHILCLVLAT